MTHQDTISRQDRRIRLRDALLIPNLLSLLRIALTPVIVIVLLSDMEHRLLVAVGVLVVSAMTDFLDGVLARRLNQVSALGLLLDPVADKILTIALTVTLTLAGGFPLWVAALVIGRDIAIVGAGVAIRRRARSVPASDLVGKYYFGSVAAMLMSYMLEFKFGEMLFLWTTLVFLGLSSVGYSRGFWSLMHDRPPIPLLDGPVWTLVLRVVAFAAVTVSLYRLYADKLAG